MRTPSVVVSRKTTSSTCSACAARSTPTGVYQRSFHQDRDHIGTYAPTASSRSITRKDLGIHVVDIRLDRHHFVLVEEGSNSPMITRKRFGNCGSPLFPLISHRFDAETLQRDDPGRECFDDGGPVGVVSSTGISVSTVGYPFKISTVAGVGIGDDPCSVEQFRRCRFARAMSNAVDMQVLQADRCADDVDDGIDRTDLMKMHFSSVESRPSPPPRRSRGRSVSPSISPVRNDPASMMVSMSLRWRWYFGCP